MKRNPTSLLSEFIDFYIARSDLMMKKSISDRFYTAVN
jgi:hypothetical protein